MNTTMVLFLGEFTLSLLLYIALAVCYVWPSVQKLPLHRAMSFLLIPHAFRHVGLLAIVPVVVAPQLAATPIAHMVAYGDLIAMLLALLAIWALHHEWKSAYVIAWVFSIWASIDILHSIVRALFLQVYTFQLSSFWIVLTFFVPLLLVTQWMIFLLLGRRLK
jgi:hypothetical protein